MRRSWPRALSAGALALLTALVTFAGCGRSLLDDVDVVPGWFCEYNDNLGQWLLVVGSHYCAAF